MKLIDKEYIMSDLSAQEFNLLIYKYFGFLINEYGFRVNKKNDWSYDIESDTTRISVFTEYTTVVIGIEPIGEEARKLLRANSFPEQLAVTVVAMCLDPNLDYKIVRGESIETAMSRESQLVKDCFRDFLHGDFSAWIAVDECRKKRR
jgi:hypothetical protein